MFDATMWNERQWGWELEGFEITPVKAGGWRLWDCLKYESVGIFDDLDAAKIMGAEAVNECLVFGSDHMDIMLLRGC